MRAQLVELITILKDIELVGFAERPPAAQELICEPGKEDALLEGMFLPAGVLLAVKVKGEVAANRFVAYPTALRPSVEGSGW
jgi:hypothetical protein